MNLPHISTDLSPKKDGVGDYTSGSIPAIAYRSEIDGLRAFAIIPVILFHAGTPLFRGGFVGVDVFFVISGYLITSICLKEIGEGTFSLWRFYERRFRRILPALFLVTAASVPFAYFWMLPDSLENFGQSVVATTLSANNILLFLTSGYWGHASEFKPLMHTWSLAVEEQYYLLFPPLLLALFLFVPRLALMVLILLALISLGASHISATRAPEATFFLLPTRSFELLAGSVCAFVGARKAGVAGAILALAGFVLILASILSFSPDTPFPSFYAMIPVAGTALIILFAHENIVARFLSLGPLVAVGLISYSLYLWHQPLFAFARIRSYEEPAAPVYLVLVAITVLLSMLSYRLVEQPCRDQRRTPLRAFAPIILWIGAVLCAVGLLFHFTHGLPGRAHVKDTSDAGGMYISYNERAWEYAAGVFPENGQPNVLVAGSSLARDFINIMFESGSIADRNVIYSPDAPVCISRRKAALDAATMALLRNADIVFLPSGYLFEHTSCMSDDLDVLKGLGVSHVYWVGPKDFGYNLNVFMSVPRDERSTTWARMKEQPFALNEALKHAAPPKSYIDIVAALGPGEEARQVRVFDDSGRLLSADGVHLTKPGARFLGEKIFGGGGLDGFR